MRDTSGRTRATLWVIVASGTLTVMAGAILGPVVPQIQDGLDVSESLAGLIITTHAAFIVVTSPVAGWAVDRFGPRRPFIVGLFVYAVGGGAGLFVDAFLPLLASRAVLGVGVGFVYTGVTVLIYDLYEGPSMDRALGLRSGASSLGGAVWPLFGGALGAISWQLPFGVYLFAMPLGVAAMLALPATDRGAGTAEADGGSDRGPGEPSRAASGVAGVVSEFRRRPALPAVYLLFFWTNVLIYAIVVFYPQLLNDVGVGSSSGIGVYLAANGAAGAVTGTLYERFTRRAGRHRLVLVALVSWSVAFGLATVADSPLSAVPTVVLFGLGVGMVFPSTYAWIESLAPTDRQGQFTSYLAMFGYVGQFLSPVVFGPVVARFGARGVFGAAAVTAGMGIVVLGGVLVQRG